MFRIALAAVAALLLIELGLHASRVVDGPRYESNDRIGYIPKANQSGAFLWTNRWAFNELSMGTERPFRPSARTDILLIGDSIVYGGNPYRAEERLGPTLERVTKTTVWPIGAGSWSLQA